MAHLITWLDTFSTAKMFERATFSETKLMPIAIVIETQLYTIRYSATHWLHAFA
jgi:hypothetical protein